MPNVDLYIFDILLFHRFSWGESCDQDIYLYNCTVLLKTNAPDNNSYYRCNNYVAKRKTFTKK